VSYPALLVDVTIFVLSLWVGFEVISKVPATLHTPLMSAANSIHGIVLAGAMLIAVTAHDAVGYVIAFLAAAFAAMNVVGGYVVTGRMLKMFRRRPAVQAGTAVQAGSGPGAVTAAANGSAANGPGSSGSASNGTASEGTAPASATAAANGSSRTGQTA
jgi:H+-translocating NAD(P) transhydrogenase subunit alpha